MNDSEKKDHIKTIANIVHMLNKRMLIYPVWSEERAKDDFLRIFTYKECKKLGIIKDVEERIKELEKIDEDKRNAKS